MLITLFLIAVFALGAIAFAASRRDADGDEPAATAGFQGALMPEGVSAPDFNLTNQDGETISMRSLRGSPVVVTFLYTTCEDTCPIQAQTVRGALDQLGHDVPAIAIAVDPPRDTPDRAKAFLSEQRALGRIDFVLGTRAALQARSGTASSSAPSRSPRSTRRASRSLMPRASSGSATRARRPRPSASRTICACWKPRAEFLLPCE